MAKHYYDFEHDDCPIHEDKDTEQFFKIEIILPIGIDLPHAGWKQSYKWSKKLLNIIKKDQEKDLTKVLSYRLGLGHIGETDHKVCVKYFIEEE